MGGKQFGFGDYEQSTANKRTKREKFLAELEHVVPWKVLIDLIEPHYPRTSSKGGRPAYPLATITRRRHAVLVSLPRPPCRRPPTFFAAPAVPPPPPGPFPWAAAPFTPSEKPAAREP